MNLKIIFMALLLLFVSGCSTVTIKKSAQGKIHTKPNYVISKDYYLLGLVGEHHFYTHDICRNGVEQIQTERTFSDGFLGLITLGIYSPHTAKIWCKGDAK